MKKLLLSALLLCAYSLQAAKLFATDVQTQKLKSQMRAQELAVKRCNGRIKRLEGEMEERQARIGEIEGRMEGKDKVVQNKYKVTIDRHKARVGKLEENLLLAKNMHDKYSTKLGETSSKLQKRPKSMHKDEAVKAEKPREIRKGRQDRLIPGARPIMNPEKPGKMYR